LRTLAPLVPSTPFRTAIESGDIRGCWPMYQESSMLN
jgi:hypothetical protein